MAELRGRVFERGTIVAIPNARIVTREGRAVADEEGRFTLRLPAGTYEVLVAADGFQPERVTEKLIGGQGLNVEYRLLTSGKHRYESTVRGASRHEGDRFTLKDEELHQLPGGLGDPFRAIGTLPGVIMPLPVLPYYAVRGATPGMIGFFVDGMRVPQLFHFLVGNVIHPQLIDRLDFYPGAYDVSLGRYAGGVVDSETRPARPDGHHGEIQLSLFNTSALLEFKLPKGVRLEVGGAYYYPGPIIHAIDDRVNVVSWDYQLRLDWKGITVEALGSYDDLSIGRPVTRMGIVRRQDDEFKLTFHRLQIRERERFGRVELEAAVVGGLDQLTYFGGAGVDKLFLNMRFNLRASWNRFRLFGGFDGEISRFTPSSFDPSLTNQQPDQAGDLGNARDGVVFGAFLEGTVDIIKNRLDATLGARLDVYHAGPVTLLGIDPRLQFKATLQPWLKITGGVGLYQQPPAFPIPLPGIDTFSLQLGLQRAIQSSVGVEFQLPKSVSFSLTGYYQRFYNVNDAAVDFGPAVCTSPPPESLTGLPSLLLRQVEGAGYGMELFLRRHTGRFTGWIAYTLSRSERIYSCGLRPSDYDQSHVLNVVVQVRLPWRLMAGLRLLVTTGRPVTILEPPDGRTTVRNNYRLPDYVQLDLRLDREWIFKKWALAVFLEALNVTYSMSVFGITYPEVDGVKNYLMPQSNGFNWILPSIGLRGHY